MGSDICAVDCDSSVFNADEATDVQMDGVVDLGGSSVHNGDSIEECGGCSGGFMATEECDGTGSTGLWILHMIRGL